jgi:hypothetical protein
MKTKQKSSRRTRKESRKIVNATYIIMIYKYNFATKAGCFVYICLLQYSNVRACCYLPSHHYLRTDYVSDVQQMSLLSSVTHCFCHLWKQFLNYICAYARKTIIKDSCFIKHNILTVYERLFLSVSQIVTQTRKMKN